MNVLNNLHRNYICIRESYLICDIWQLSLFPDPVHSRVVLRARAPARVEGVVGVHRAIPAARQALRVGRARQAAPLGALVAADPDVVGLRLLPRARGLDLLALAVAVGRFLREPRRLAPT